MLVQTDASEDEEFVVAHGNHAVQKIKESA
jgi:hypothetical protein